MGGMDRAALRPALVLLLALASAGTGGGDDDLAKALESAEVKDRLEAVKTLAEGSRPDAEDLLLTATADKDWEVAIKACEALAKKATDKSVRPLAELCFQAPV